VDALKLSNKVPSIFDGSPKMCGVWRYRDERRRLSYWSILIAFSRLLGVIFPVVNSRGWNQSFDWTTAAHSERFLSNLTIHTASLFLASILTLSPFAELHFASTTIFFVYYYRM